MKSKYLFLIPLIVCSMTLTAQNENWTLLAKKDVGFKTDTDVITLYGAQKQIEAVKMVCTQGSLKIKELAFIYPAGDTIRHQPKGTGILTKGVASIPIKADPEKKLNKIQMHYEAYGNMVLTKRAKVEILGRQKSKNTN